MSSNTRPSLGGRAAVAVALLVGFYVFALAIAALLIWWPLVAPFVIVKRAVKHVATASETRDTRRAIELLDDAGAVELELVAFHVPKANVSAWPTVAWKDVWETVVAPGWRRLVDQHHRLLEGLTVGDLARLAADPKPFARKVRGSELCSPSPSDIQRSRLVLECALALVLSRSGWTLETGPGEPVRARRGEDSIEPLGLLEKLVTEPEALRRWHELVARERLAAAPLVTDA